MSRKGCSNCWNPNRIRLLRQPFSPRQLPPARPSSRLSALAGGRLPPNRVLGVPPRVRAVPFPRPSPGPGQAALRALRGNRSTSPQRPSVKEVMASHLIIVMGRWSALQRTAGFGLRRNGARHSPSERDSKTTADSTHIKDAPPPSGLRAARGRLRRSLIRVSLRRGRRSWRGRGTARRRSPLGGFGLGTLHPQSPAKDP